MGRLILGITNPRIHANYRDRNPLNNQRNNLRPATLEQKASYRRIPKNNKSTFIGVIQINKRWRATVKHNKTSHVLGTFATKEEAALAYNKKAETLHKEFANNQNKIPTH